MSYITLTVCFDFLTRVSEPNYSMGNACANKVVPDQPAPSSSLIRDYLFALFSKLFIDNWYRLVDSISINWEIPF